MPERLRNALGIAVGEAHLPGLPRAARLRPLAAARERGRAAAAAAVGEHRHQGPEGAPTCSTSRRSRRRSPSTRCRRRRCSAFADHGEVGELAARRRRRCRGGARRASRRAGVDVDALAARAPGRGRRGVRRLVERADGGIDDQSAALAQARPTGSRSSAPTARARPRGRRSRRTTREIGGRAPARPVRRRPGRGERLTAEAAGLYLDYSKNRITDETLGAAGRARRGVAACASASTRCSAASKINVTEDRAVLHVALRAPAGAAIVVDGVDVVPQVHEVLDRMAAFADRVRSGEWTGHTGKRIRNVVNIGIGGSDLGPVMAYEALRHYTRPRHDVPLRLERRRHRLRRGDARPRPGRDAVHRLVEDVHDARDDDQRPHGPRLGARGARRRGGDRQALRRGLDQRRRGRASSASTPPTCSASGTGSAAATRWTRRSASRR